MLVGAGLPRELPQLLGRLAGHQSVGLPVEVGGAADGSHAVDLDPRALLGDDLPSLARPARAGSRTNPAEWSAREALHWLLPERPGPRR